MPRQQRQFEIGGIYHVINRGVEKRDIFMKAEDYYRFILGLELFNSEEPMILRYWTEIDRGQTPVRPGSDPVTRPATRPIVEIMAFVLMPNHYHLIMREIVDGGISDFMQKMGGYAGFFNKKYNRVGSLFQSRYKAISIRSEGQLGIIFQYVHTNPVEIREPYWKDLKVQNKQKALEWLNTYKWSSYHDYIGKPAFPAVIKRDFFLDFFGGERKCRRVVEDWVSFKAQRAQSETKELE